MNAISQLLILGNIGFAAFVAVAPQGAMPWYVVAGVAALNAVVHALPSEGLIKSKGVN